MEEKIAIVGRKEEPTMAEAAVKCPHCQSEAVVRYGKTSNGKERFRCQQTSQCGRTFLRSYAYPGCLPTVKQQIVDMTLNGSGIRDIARVLHVGSNTVMRELKKSGRPLPSQHERRGGMLSRGDHGRSAARRGRRGG
jgi:transposase-like protein